MIATRIASASDAARTWFDESRRTRLRNYALGLLIGWLVAWFVVELIKPRYTFGFNETESLPYTFFVIEKGVMPKRGELIAFWVPEELRRGKPPLIFTKFAMGVAGDVVSWNGRHFYLNGQYLGAAKEKSLKGEPLSPSAGGIVPEGHYFAWTPHKDSFDSRYSDFGFIKPGWIVGRARAIF